MDEPNTNDQDNPPPSLNDLASASAGAYNDVPPMNYTKLDAYSNSEISTFKHKENSNYIIAHKGTDLSNPNSAKKDVRSDLNIALGNKEADALHKRRTKNTERIIKGIKKESKDANIYLTGYSLGGSTSSHAMASSKYVRDNVKQHDTFNSGSSALQKAPDVSPEVKEELMKKSTHHRIKGDAISDHVKDNLIGTVKEYESKKKPSIADHILKLATPLLKRTFVGRALGYGAKRVLDTLRAHSLTNFTRK